MDELDSPLAERRLVLASDQGDLREVRIRIGKPKFSTEDFYCEFQITGLGEYKAGQIYGIDSMQALVLTLRFVKAVVTDYSNESKLSLYWQEPGDDLGLA